MWDFLKFLREFKKPKVANEQKRPFLQIRKPKPLQKKTKVEEESKVIVIDLVDEECPTEE
jgi:hypothetical protein|tara:strand:+ start:269 stop:448 length:180 start_codon:yes stop_codon:yes gene_type:complete